MAFTSDTSRDWDLSVAGPGLLYDEVLVEVHATAINPSDLKNVAGSMPQTRPPRTPGRDFAGRVVAGPERWLGASKYVLIPR